MKGVGSALLAFEAITALLAVLVAVTSTDVSGAVAWSVFGALVVLCIAGAATMRRGMVGWVIGSLAQLVAIGSGFLVSVMFFIGGLFAAIWVLTYVLGQRIDAMNQTATPPAA